MKTVKLLVLTVMTVMGLTMCTQNKQKADVQEAAVDSCAVLPEFPGGLDSLSAFINANISYPQQAVEAGMEGRVMVGFVVEKDGKVSEIAIEESADSLFDAEALRVVNLLPAFTPGKDDEGNALRVKLSLPISFLMHSPMANEEAEVMPQFPGGQDALMAYLSENIKYPAEAEAKAVQGRVVLSFTIDETGKPTDVNVLKSVDAQLDAEAVRVIKAMPAWTPGQNGGKAVSVRYTFPVTFQLER